MKGYYQLIEGHGSGFMFTLRAGNHETIFESRVYWSRQAALDAVAATRAASQDPRRYVKLESPEGRHFFELVDDAGRTLGRSNGCHSRSALAAGMASVQRNAPSQTFRGLVRRTLVLG
ncbi:MAG: YegP family protein [Rubrivivax sp.]|jgi:uncharacterized protein YegP (UPF0339 family)|nr:YegP family protein [Rubrivivax sp.]